MSKRRGEQLIREYEAHFPTCIVRFAALYSDWCEYPPLFVFLRAWLSEAWNRRILGGHGNFGVPYLHVRDVVRCPRHLLERLDDVEPSEVFLTSTDGSVTVRELFEAAIAYVHGRSEKVLSPDVGLVALHSCAVGLLLLLAPGWSVSFGGFDGLPSSFFVRQGGLVAYLAVRASRPAGRPAAPA